METGNKPKTPGDKTPAALKIVAVFAVAFLAVWGLATLAALRLNPYAAPPGAEAMQELAPLLHPNQGVPGIAYVENEVGPLQAYYQFADGSLPKHLAPRGYTPSWIEATPTNDCLYYIALPAVSEAVEEDEDEYEDEYEYSDPYEETDAPPETGEEGAQGGPLYRFTYEGGYEKIIEDAIEYRVLPLGGVAALDKVGALWLYRAGQAEKIADGVTGYACSGNEEWLYYSAGGTMYVKQWGATAMAQPTGPLLPLAISNNGQLLYGGQVSNGDIALLCYENGNSQPNAALEETSRLNLWLPYSASEALVATSTAVYRFTQEGGFYRVHTNTARLATGAPLVMLQSKAEEDYTAHVYTHALAGFAEYLLWEKGPQRLYHVYGSGAPVLASENAKDVQVSPDGKQWYYTQGYAQLYRQQAVNGRLQPAFRVSNLAESYQPRWREDATGVNWIDCLYKDTLVRYVPGQPLQTLHTAPNSEATRLTVSSGNGAHTAFLSETGGAYLIQGNAAPRRLPGLCKIITAPTDKAECVYMEGPRNGYWNLNLWWYNGSKATPLAHDVYCIREISLQDRQDELYEEYSY